MKTRATLLLLIALLTSCGPANEKSKGKPHIVATTGMLYDVVVNIVGNNMTTDVIMGPGVDPHLYKATPGDLDKLNQADIIIYNGILLEGKMIDILKKLGRTKSITAAAESIPDSLLQSSASYDDVYDPHVWFDVKRWRYVVKSINQTIIDNDPDNTEFYQKQTEAHLSKLDSLHDFAVSRVKEIPVGQRILITAHDAFGYFGEAYGIKVEAIQGISTVADFGLRDIVSLTDLIIEHKIKAIFIETSVSEKSINALVTGCREKGHAVEIGGYLYSDAMGEFGTEEGTFIGMFKHNINTIVESLK